MLAKGTKAGRGSVAGCSSYTNSDETKVCFIFISLYI